MDSLFNTVFAETYTTQDLHKRLGLLRSYVTDKAFKKDAPAQVPTNEQAWLEEKIQIKEIQVAIKTDKVAELFSKLEKEIQSITPVTLFLAVDLAEESLVAICKSIRDTNEALWVDVKVDPTLIGGAALAFHGVYKDYSVKTQLEEKKEEIIKIFQETQNAKLKTQNNI